MIMPDVNADSPLFLLPPVILNKVLGYISYDELAKKRVVCRSFNEKAQVLLNDGFGVANLRHKRFAARIKVRGYKRSSYQGILSR